MEHVADDANDAIGNGVLPLQDELVSERILARKDLVGQCLVDDDHVRTIAGVGGLEQAAFPQRDPHRLEIVARDDPHIRDVVCFALRRAGYQPLPADNGLAALELAAREAPALVVLDILMPELDGTEVCKRLRQGSDVPIIFLTSKDEEMDRILGLELGADDYVVKPFSPRELVARVKTVLRRKGPAVTAEQRLVRGRLVVDLEAIAASWDGAAVSLTATEFALLKAIAAQPRRVFTRENLMTASYVGARFVSDRTIDSHTRHIRAKFQSVGGDRIETVHGVGYRLATT